MQYYINLSSANNLAKFGRQYLSHSSVFQQQQQITCKKMTSGDEEPAPKTTAQQATNNDQQQQQQQQHERAGSPVRSSNNHLPSTKQAAADTYQRGRTTNDQSEQETTSDRRPFDVIIFAASSSVGRYLVEELALVVDKHYPTSSSSSSSNQSSDQPANLRHLQVDNQFSQHAQRRRSVPTSSKSGHSIKWAVAGRSAVRLSETLCQAELSTGIRNLSTSIPVMLADLNHHRSLLGMCEKTQLVINCAGPYSELGAEVLIQACIESGTHYVDLAHETTFVESMTRLYSERAKSRNVLILNGCGFQSMSAECGINFMKQVVDGRIEQVKIILSLSDTSALIKLGPSGGGGGSACASLGGNPNAPQSAGIVSRGMWNSLLAEKLQEISIEERMSRQQVVASRRLAAAAGATTTSSGEFPISDDECDDGQDKAPDEDHHESSHLLRSPGRVDNKHEDLLAKSGRANGQMVKSAGRLLERKDTQWLVKDIVQFRNRAVSIAWPLQLIQGFQIQKGRGYCWPIDSLTSDESQLIRSEMNNYELRRPDLDSSDGWRPIRTSSYFSVKNFTHLCLLFVWLFLFQILIKFAPTRYLMRKLPALASLGHVTSQTASGRALLGANGSNGASRQPLDRDALSHIKYCQTFIAYGQPGDSSGDPLEERRKHTARRQVQLLVSRVVGPEPNHVATATFAVQAALTILMERDHLPASGGVLTPGAAFAETNIIYQLRRRNIKFEVLKKA